MSSNQEVETFSKTNKMSSNQDVEIKLFKERLVGPIRYNRINQSFSIQKTLKEIQDEIEENNTISDLCAFFDSEREDYTHEIGANKYLIIYSKSNFESIPDMKILKDSVTIPTLDINSLIRMYDKKYDNVDYPKYPISITRIEVKKISNRPISEAMQNLTEDQRFCVIENFPPIPQLDRDRMLKDDPFYRKQSRY